MKCPFLDIPESELTKVAHQYREEVTKDATKCIEQECSSFNEGVCIRPPSMPVFQLKLGTLNENELGVYGVQCSMLANSNPEFSSIFSENTIPDMTTLTHRNFTVQCNSADEIVESLRKHLLDENGRRLVISKRSIHRDN